MDILKELLPGPDVVTALTLDTFIIIICYAVKFDIPGEENAVQNTVISYSH